MAPSTELVVFETSDAFRSNPEIITAGFDVVLQAQGAHSPGYYGKQVENPGTGYLFLNWESYEAHKAVLDGPFHSQVVAGLKPCLDGKMEMNHIQFSGPTTALERPVTSVLLLTLKAPGNRDAVVDILSKISEGNDIVYGKTREDENKWVVIGGWATVEAHLEHAAKPEMVAAIDKLGSLANKDHLFHTKLAQYTL